jgi:stage V sporulation protein SpoVS
MSADSGGCPPDCACCESARSAEKAIVVACEIFARRGALVTDADVSGALAYAATRLGRSDVTAKDLGRVTRAVRWYAGAGGFVEMNDIPVVFVSFYLIDLVSGDVFAWIRAAGDFAWEEVIVIEASLQGRPIRPTLTAALAARLPPLCYRPAAVRRTRSSLRRGWSDPRRASTRGATRCKGRFT